MTEPMGTLLSRLPPKARVLTEADVYSDNPRKRTLATADAVKDAEKYAAQAQQSLSTINATVEEATRNLAIQGEAIIEDATTQATSASNSASSASTSATKAETAFNDTNAIKTELSDALTEAKGVATRVTKVENKVQPTMAGGFLKVKEGHNAMVRVCEYNHDKHKDFQELVKGFGYSAPSINYFANIQARGCGEFWIVSFAFEPRVALVCDPYLEYKFAIDGINPLGGGNPFSSGYQSGKGFACNNDSSRLYHIKVEYKDITGENLSFYVQSWTTVDIKDDAGNIVTQKGTKLAWKKHSLFFERGYVTEVSFVYLPRANLLLVGGKMLLDPETLEYIGDVEDATTDANNASVLANRALGYAFVTRLTFKKEGLVAVCYGDSFVPFYVDDYANQLKPVLRNFVDENGGILKDSSFSLANTNTIYKWDSCQTYLLRFNGGKLAWRIVNWSWIDEPKEIKGVCGAEVVSNVVMTGYKSFIANRTREVWSTNKYCPIAFLSYGGAIEQQIGVSTKDAIPSVDTMVDQGKNQYNTIVHLFSPQAEYGYMITQAGCKEATSVLSVIIQRIYA